MQTLAVKQKIKYNQKFVVQSKPKNRTKNIIKQKICGVVLVVCGAVPIIIEKDVTAFVFLAIFFLPMIFGKQYIMTFKD